MRPCWCPRRSRADVRFTLLGAEACAPVETKHIPNAHHPNPVWSDTLRLPLPFGFDDGELKVAAFDRDASQNDEAIGAVVVAIGLAGGSHRVVLKGKEQAATAGHRFPNFEIEFTYRCSGLTDREAQV